MQWRYLLRYSRGKNPWVLREANITYLERKTVLINEMKAFNDLAEKNPAVLNERFYQEYGWTVEI